jgi:DNA-binding XRE family transcriptional regulator
MRDRTVAGCLQISRLRFITLEKWQRICGEAVAESESFARAQRRVRTSLGRKVKGLRISLEMTQAELADEAEIRRALVSDIERGKANPTLDSIVRLATALGVETAELLNFGR